MNGSASPERRTYVAHPTLLGWVRGALDVSVSCALLYVLSTTLLGSELSPDYRLLLIVSAFLMAFVYSTTRVYRPVPTIFRMLLQLLRGWILVIGGLLIIGFLTQASDFYSRPVMIAWFFLAPVAQVVNGIVVRQLLPRIIGKQRRLVSAVLGSGEHAQRLAAAVENERGSQEEMCGIIEAVDATTSTPGAIGTSDRLRELIAERRIRRLYLALPLDQAATMRAIYLDLLSLHVDVVWAPDIFGFQLLNHGVDDLGGLPVIYMSSTPLGGAAGVLKSAYDRLGAGLGLLATAPALLVIALAVRLSSKGPILFRQRRRGWDGVEFTVYKFRSMFIHEEAAGTVTQARRNDDRVTPVGRVLRKTSLDELPQLLNVLRGEMSLVGPRPHAVEHDEYYGARIDAYLLRHRIKPGLTGLAQVNGYRGETRSLEAMEARIQYDLLYINTWSVWLDLRIIVRTIFVLPFQKGAY